VGDTRLGERPGERPGSRTLQLEGEARRAGAVAERGRVRAEDRGPVLGVVAQLLSGEGGRRRRGRREANDEWERGGHQRTRAGAACGLDPWSAGLARASRMVKRRGDYARPVNDRSRQEVARRAGVDPGYVDRLVELGILRPAQEDAVSQGDVLTARWVRGLEA